MLQLVVTTDRRHFVISEVIKRLQQNQQLIA